MVEGADQPRERALPHFTSLTGLRFVAALLVFLHHAGNNLRVPETVQAANNKVPLLTNGTTGVALFFALSGFVITVSYADAFLTGRSGARQFLLRRVARIAPAYYVAVTLTIPIGLFRDHEWKYLGLHYTGLQSWVPTEGAWQQWNGLLWSVSTEAGFYVFFALLAGLVLKLRDRPAILVGAWLACWGLLMLIHYVVQDVHGRYAVDWWTFRFPPVRAIEFFMGVLTGLLYLHRRGKPLPFLIGPLASAVLLGLVLTNGGAEQDPPSYSQHVVPLCSLLLYWCASTDGPVVRLLGSRPLERLGEWSYSFYLFHAAIYIGVGGLLREVAPSLLEHKEPLLPVVAVCFLLSVAAGALMYRFVEVPAQRALLRRWRLGRG